MLSRRVFVASVASLFATPRLAAAQAAGPHSLAPLPYAAEANDCTTKFQAYLKGGK